MLLTKCAAPHKCEYIGVTYEDTEFDRQWIVIDWCEYTESQKGIIVFTQSFTDRELDFFHAAPPKKVVRYVRKRSLNP